MVCLVARAMPETDLIVQVLLDPGRTLSLDCQQWDLLIRQGRRANLLGKLAVCLAEKNLMEGIPDAPYRHITSALKMANRQDLAIRWEVSRIAKAMSLFGIDFVLLKGAAYVMAELPCSRGRTFSDVDILVPKTRIIDAENALRIHGWQSGHHDEYDQRYYRQWMHEIPPMMHVRRGTTIDVHHAILPETARIKVNTAALFENVLPVKGFNNVFVLGPIDMVLHSATHLFHEGELDNGLRDLFDLDSMLCNFSRNEGFWAALLPRALELGLERPLFYAIRFANILLNTPVPANLLHDLSKAAPPFWVGHLMTACYKRALRPNHSSSSPRWTWLARKALYIRSHWMRMPIGQLVRHLAHKAFISRGAEPLELTAERKLDL